MKHKTKSAQLRKEIAREKKLFNTKYAEKEDRLYRRLAKKLRLEKPKYWWREQGILMKIFCVIMALIVLFVASAYGIARWYIHSQSNKEFKFGATFIPSYAQYYGLDPQETMKAMIDDLGIKHFRLVSYWSRIEKSPGVYDFSELDWQFRLAEATNSTVSLSIGLRQPRWPECHQPTWTHYQSKAEWYPQLKEVMRKTIERYKNSPALQTYQLENEFFLKVFGECPDFDRDRLIDEFNFVKQLDPNTPVIISRSNNAIGLPIGQPRPDIFGISVYKRVWDKTLTKRYFEYPFPAWFYGFLAGAGKIVTGRDMIIHELQTEPWGPNKGMTEISIEEQNKSMDAKRLVDRIKYGKATGMREVDLWGVEMWYWRKTKLNDPSLWEAGKKTLYEQQCSQCYK